MHDCNYLLIGKHVLYSIYSWAVVVHTFNPSDKGICRPISECTTSLVYRRSSRTAKAIRRKICQEWKEGRKMKGRKEKGKKQYIYCFRSRLQLPTCQALAPPTGYLGLHWNKEQVVLGQLMHSLFLPPAMPLGHSGVCHLLNRDI